MHAVSWTYNNTNDYFSKNIWTYTAKGANETVPWPKPRTESEMVRDVLSRAEDGDFFGDMVTWLEKDAPRKLKSALRDLSAPMHTGEVSYERLCEVLYKIGFRASEVLVRRMTLGPSNEWVRKYFQDFPPASQKP